MVGAGGRLDCRGGRDSLESRASGERECCRRPHRPGSFLSLALGEHTLILNTSLGEYVLEPGSPGLSGSISPLRFRWGWTTPEGLAGPDAASSLIP